MQLKVDHYVEDWPLFLAERGLRIDIVGRACELGHASHGGYRHKDLLVDGTFKDLPASVQMRAGGSAAIDGSTAAATIAHKTHALRSSGTYTL